MNQARPIEVARNQRIHLWISMAVAGLGIVMWVKFRMWDGVLLVTLVLCGLLSEIVYQLQVIAGSLAMQLQDRNPIAEQHD